MQWLHSIWAWIQAHPEVTIASVLYIIVNIMPRLDHTKLTGWRKIIWETLDRASFLTREKVPGRLKFILATSPQLEEPAELEEPAKPEGD